MSFFGGPSAEAVARMAAKTAAQTTLSAKRRGIEDPAVTAKNAERAKVVAAYEEELARLTAKQEELKARPPTRSVQGVDITSNDEVAEIGKQINALKEEHSEDLASLGGRRRRKTRGRRTRKSRRSRKTSRRKY